MDPPLNLQGDFGFADPLIWAHETNNPPVNVGIKFCCVKSAGSWHLVIEMNIMPVAQIPKGQKEQGKPSSGNRNGGPQ